MCSLLYNNINYNSGIVYIVSSYIREYDIAKANINVLYKYKAIDLDTYNKCLNMDKYDREVFIGLLQQSNPNITEILKAGIIQAKKEFFEANDIQDNEVLSIKNDAVFLINKIPMYIKFDNIEFVNKDVFTSYYRIFDKEFYYNFNPLENKEKLVIKGMKKVTQELHQNYLIDFFKAVFYSAQNDSIENTLNIIISFNEKYINLELPIEFYRNFDALSMYSLKPIMMYEQTPLVNNLAEKDKIYINTICNLNIIRELHKIFSTIYFSNR